MEPPVQKTLDYVAEVEIAAEDVLADRRQVIDLDAQRQKTRQAVRFVDEVPTCRCYQNKFRCLYIEFVIVTISECSN